jgi:hypothetical protein
MNRSSLSFLFAVCAALTLIPSLVQAGSEVRFSNRELEAGFVLLRPELNEIEVNGLTGHFTPAPALRFFGLEDQRFEINFSPVIDLVDLEFNHLKAKVPQVRFSDGSLELRIPLHDKEKVLQSRLGSISIQGGELIAELGWKTFSNGRQQIELRHARFNGDMKGTGILRPQYILLKTRQFLVFLLSRQVRQILKNPKVHESIEEGLKTWARFTLGTSPHDVIEGTLRFDRDGLRYQVE